MVTKNVFSVIKGYLDTSQVSWLSIILSEKHKFTFAWARIKGDWWHDTTDVNRSFFSVNRKNKSLFIGRLATQYIVLNKYNSVEE